MKKINILGLKIVALLVILFLSVTCDDMNDIQSKFTEIKEKTYLGKVDSIKSFPGYGRAKLTWYIGSDPEIEKTIIYWNMRNDSIIKDFVRHKPGLQRDSIILENLPEGSFLLEFRNVNSEGKTSLYSSTTVRVWGKDFAQGLSSRNIKSHEFDHDFSSLKLTLSDSYAGDSVVYSEIKFTDLEGLEKNIRIDRNTNSLVLTNFPDGEELNFRTVFFLPQGVDTVYGDYEIFKSPKVVFERGEKVTIGEGLESKYFNRNEDKLYEWKSNGNVTIYENIDGTFVQTENIPDLVPRSTYREFFFYDDDRFIAINTAGVVTMQTIVNGQFSRIGVANFGLGFLFPTFVPAKGFFYSIDKGELKTWFANNDATWGIPNGTTVETGFTHPVYALFKYKTLIWVDDAGSLWYAPISTTGYLKSKNKIGSGWNRFKKLVAVGDILLAMDASGDLWKFNFDTKHYWVVDKPL